MPNYKFFKFNKGWVHKQPQLTELDGFSDVNNWVVFKNAIEKVRGWEKLPLLPINASVGYPLEGFEIQSIHDYVKFEEENIRIGNVYFDHLLFFGLPKNIRWLVDFPSFPTLPDTDNEPNPDGYGLIYTCDLVCGFPEISYTWIGGNFIAGPAIRVDPSSTADSASLLGFVYNPFSHQLVFGRWINQPLTDYSAILFSIAATLISGDVIKIVAVASDTYQLFLNAALLATITDILPLSSECVGLILLRASSTS